MKKLLMAALLLSFGSSAFAGSVAMAKINKIRVDGDGKVIIYFDKTLVASASCAVEGFKNALAIDTKAPGGAAVLTFALAAKATKTTVSAHGIGSCGVYGGGYVETWSYGVTES